MQCLIGLTDHKVFKKIFVLTLSKCWSWKVYSQRPALWLLRTILLEKESDVQQPGLRHTRWFYQVLWVVAWFMGSEYGLRQCTGRTSSRLLGCGLGFHGVIIGEKHTVYEQGSDSENSFREVFQAEYRVNSMKN